MNEEELNRGEREFAEAAGAELRTSEFELDPEVLDRLRAARHEAVAAADLVRSRIQAEIRDHQGDSRRDRAPSRDSANAR